jgi:putative transposase
MKHVNTVLHQLLRHIPRHRFEQVVERYQGDRRVRSLNCWTQLVALVYAQLAQRLSLRDLEMAFNSHSACHYHLGASPIRRSTLADANASRNPSLFREVFFWLLSRLRGELPEAQELVRLIDSTTIDLNLNRYGWAKFRSTKGGVKIHTVYDPHAQTPTYFEMTHAKCNDAKAGKDLPLLDGATYVFDRAYNDYGWYWRLTLRNIAFVGRMKTNACYEVTARRGVAGDVLADETIRLASAKGRQYQGELRRIVYLREDGRELVFMTNDFGRTAQAIADLYKQRWQIELFFKWIKQNLKIKRFLGTSQNAVLIQVIIAMIAYLLIRLAQLGFPNALSLQEWARLISANILARKSLPELAAPPKPLIPPNNNQQLAISFT